MLYWTDKDSALDKDSSEDPFGVALEAVTAGETETINVLLIPKATVPGDITIADLDDDIQDKVVTLDVTSVDGANGTAAVTIQSQDLAGNNLAKNVLIRAWTSAASMGAAAASEGLAVAADALIIMEHLANADIDIITDATGKAVLTITDAAGTYYLMTECQGIVTSTTVTITG
jgi:hypothetical protein